MFLTRIDGKRHLHVAPGLQLLLDSSFETHVLAEYFPVAIVESARVWFHVSMTFGAQTFVRAGNQVEASETEIHDNSFPEGPTS